MLLGKILVEEGYCEQADVILALDEQQLGDNRKLGEILIQNKAITYLDLVMALSIQSEFLEKQKVTA